MAKKIIEALRPRKFSALEIATLFLCASMSVATPFEPMGLRESTDLPESFIGRYAPQDTKKKRK